MKNKQNEKKKHIFKRSCQKTNDVLYDSDRCIKMTNGRMSCLSAHSVLKYEKSSLTNITKKSESLQTEGRHFRSMICKLSDV